MIIFYYVFILISVGLVSIGFWNALSSIESYGKVKMSSSIVSLITAEKFMISFDYIYYFYKLMIIPFLSLFFKKPVKFVFFKD